MKNKYLVGFFWVVLGCGFGLSLIPGRAHGAPFTNGSFESSSVDPGGSFATLLAGDASINGWTVTASIDYIGGYWLASDGNRSLDLNAGAAGGIEQTFDTIVGVRYEVKFDLAGNPTCGPTTKQMQVQVVGGDSMVATFDTSNQSQANMGWNERTFFFVATSPSTTLRFTSLIGSACGPALDNVRVTAVGAATPVPAPHAALLLGAGLASLLGYRWRRKKTIKPA